MMNTKYSFRIFSLALLLLLNTFALAESLSPDESNALRQAVIDMQTAFDEGGDMSMIVEKTHPSIIASLGGQEAFEEMMAEVPKMLEAQGIEVLNTEVGEPSVVNIAGNEEVVFVPRIQELEMAAQNIKLRSTSFLIAVREVGSDTWQFMDGSGLRDNSEQLWLLLPDLPRDVVLPQNTFEPFN